MTTAAVRPHPAPSETADPLPPVEPAATGGAGVAYPAIPAGIALQLGALGIVLAMLSLANAGLYNATAAGIVIPIAFSIGAVAIFTGGIINFRAGILVAGVIGCLYGMFWLSVGILLEFTAKDTIAAAGAGAFGDALGSYYLIWGIMSLGLALPVYFVSKVVFTQQWLLAVVFFVLAAAEYKATGTGLAKAGGYLGIIDAVFCFYISMSLVTNETAGKTILPLP